MGALIVPPVDVPRCLVMGGSATLDEESAGVRRGAALVRFGSSGLSLADVPILRRGPVTAVVLCSGNCWRMGKHLVCYWRWHDRRTNLLCFRDCIVTKRSSVLLVCSYSTLRAPQRPYQLYRSIEYTHTWGHCTPDKYWTRHYKSSNQQRWRSDLDLGKDTI